MRSALMSVGWHLAEQGVSLMVQSERNIEWHCGRTGQVLKFPGGVVLCGDAQLSIK